MRQSQYSMKPQDVVVLLKVIALNNDNWQQIPLAHSLKMSQSEVSQSVARSKYAGLLDDNGKKVMRQALYDFLQYGLAVVFPAKPGAVVRGIPTAHSTAPLNKEINSGEEDKSYNQTTGSSREGKSSTPGGAGFGSTWS